MVESNIKILDTYFLPKRISFGLLVSPCFFEGRYLNPLTISLHICNFIYWASTIFYFVGSLAALASVLCFPDNLDKLPSVVPFFAFLVLYSITWLLTLRINKLSSEVHI